MFNAPEKSVNNLLKSSPPNFLVHSFTVSYALYPLLIQSIVLDNKPSAKYPRPSAAGFKIAPSAVNLGKRLE